MMDFETMSGPDLATAYNSMAKVLGRGEIKKFRTRTDGVKRCKEVSALMARKNSKAKFGSDIKLELYDKMLAHISANPDATLAEIMAATGYRRQDFDWDLSRGKFKTVKVTNEVQTS